HDDAEARNLIAEHFEHGSFQPSFAKSHAGRLASHLMRKRAVIRRMLKEREARFLPETMSKKNGRIDCRRKNRSGDGLRHVVKRDELSRANLKVNLETGVARLHHDVVVRNL